MANTYSNLLVHIIFSTKNRVPWITQDLQDSLYGYLGGVARNLRATLLAIGGMPDHVHLLVRVPTELALAELVRTLKANSSRWLNTHRRARGQTRLAWQAGYGAFSVSESQVAVVERYIAQQEEHHRRTSFREELARLLEKHGVSFDERYLLG